MDFGLPGVEGRVSRFHYYSSFKRAPPNGFGPDETVSMEKSGLSLRPRRPLSVADRDPTLLWGFHPIAERRPLLLEANGHENNSLRLPIVGIY